MTLSSLDKELRLGAHLSLQAPVAKLSFPQDCQCLFPPDRVNSLPTGAEENTVSAEQLVFCEEVTPHLDSLWCLFTEEVPPMIVL